MKDIIQKNPVFRNFWQVKKIPRQFKIILDGARAQLLYWRQWLVNIIVVAYESNLNFLNCREMGNLDNMILEEAFCLLIKLGVVHKS